VDGVDWVLVGSLFTQYNLFNAQMGKLFYVLRNSTSPELFQTPHADQGKTLLVDIYEVANQRG